MIQKNCPAQEAEALLKSQQGHLAKCLPDLAHTQQNSPSGWQAAAHGGMQRHFEFPTYRQAQQFVNRRADLGEELQRYPEISWSQKTVKISLVARDINCQQNQDTSELPQLIETLALEMT